MKSYLHLANGKTYEGKLLTKQQKKAVSGEIVFFTGMTGYQEVLTDPSYKDQIIVFTFPLIGNYGINDTDFESKKPHAAGVVVYEGGMTNSHWQSKYSLQEYLDKWDIPLISGIDTRSVVKQIRKEGSMVAAISDSPAAELNEDCADPLFPFVPQVSSKNIKTYGSGGYHIVLLDFGYKQSILDSLLDFGCKVTVVPFDTDYETMKQLKPDGIMLSNGPGNPKQLKEQLPDIKKTISSYPTMAICLGHQLTALAFGGDTKKMLFGHRGANQPVVDLKTKRVYMSSQNHSYEVNEESLAGTGLAVRFRNVNDHTVEGMVHHKLPIITTQYHPEANPGPSESKKLFEDFFTMINDYSGREKTYA